MVVTSTMVRGILPQDYHLAVPFPYNEHKTILSATDKL